MSTYDFNDKFTATVVLPWTEALSCLRVLIIGNLMTRRRMTLDAAVTKHRAALESYDADIHDLMMQVIAESPHQQGLPAILSRSGTFGMSRMLYVTHVKTDVNDKTVDILDRAVDTHPEMRKT